MIRIQDLFRLQDVHNLRLIAGQTGLNRAVRAAILFEYDETRMQLSDFYRGDLVVTTLAYAREDEALVVSSLQALMKQGIAGLMVKTGYYGELPAAVTEAADAEGIPLFLFDDTYIEEVILEVTGLIRGSQRFPGYERDLDELMSGRLSSDEVRDRVRRIDPWGGEARLYALLCEGGIQGVTERLSLLPPEELQRVRAVLMSWGETLIALTHPAGDGESAQLDGLLERAGIAPEEVIVGESAVAAPEETDTALQEAVFAARAARATGRKRLDATHLGLYAWLLPMTENPFICGHCRRQMGRLRAYDRQNNANMEQTAREYVYRGMEIAATAKALFQHPNTVRYRLGKIRSLMDIDEEENFELLLSLAVRLSDLLEREG